MQQRKSKAIRIRILLMFVCIFFSFTKIYSMRNTVVSQLTYLFIVLKRAVSNVTGIFYKHCIHYFFNFETVQLRTTASTFSFRMVHYYIYPHIARSLTILLFSVLCSEDICLSKGWSVGTSYSRYPYQRFPQFLHMFGSFFS